MIHAGFFYADPRFSDFYKYLSKKVEIKCEKIEFKKDFLITLIQLNIMEDQLLDDTFDQTPTHWNPTQDEKTLALISHIGTLVAGFIVPLVIWLTQKDKSDYVTYHGKESLNFQITMFIIIMASVILTFVVVGIFLLIAAGIFNLVVVIIATVKASEGEAYKYPINLRLIK